MKAFDQVSTTPLGELLFSKVPQRQGRGRGAIETSRQRFLLTGNEGRCRQSHKLTGPEARRE